MPAWKSNPRIYNSCLSSAVLASTPEIESENGMALPPHRSHTCNLKEDTPARPSEMGSIFSGHASYTPLWHSDPTPDYWSSSIGDDAHSIVPVSEQERLEDIIGISLERTCYGFAPSQGRRCRNPIARHSLNIASRLLNLGNEQLCNGHDISQTLERLVPLSFAGDIINTRPQLYPSGGQRRSLLHWRKDNPPMLSLLALLSHSGSQRMLASLRPDEFVLQYHQGV